LGGFALGSVLGWTNPTGPQLNAELGDTNWSWVAALMPLGGAVAVIPVGYLIDKIGRKYTMLGLVIPFTGGWAFLAWAGDSEDPVSAHTRLVL
jgi:SP family facilitated glucose transporter-like MFS transporter 8